MGRRRNASWKRIAVGLVLVAVAGAGGWGLWQATRHEPAPPSKRYDAVRARVADAMYVEEDPDTGNVMVLRAVRATTKDGKVGKLFRTPLRQSVELREVEVELRGADAQTILTGEAPRGAFEPDKKVVTLTERPLLRKGKVEFRAKRVELSFSGQLKLRGGYGVFRDGERIGGGRDYAGPAAELMVRE